MVAGEEDQARRGEGVVEVKERRHSKQILILRVWPEVKFIKFGIPAG